MRSFLFSLLVIVLAATLVLGDADASKSDQPKSNPPAPKTATPERVPQATPPSPKAATPISKAVPQQGHSSSKVDEKVDEMASNLMDEMSNLANSIQTTIDVVKRGNEEAAQAEEASLNALKSHNERLDRIETEVGEIKNLLETVSQSLKKSSENSANFERLSKSQEEILAQLNGGLLESIAKSFAHLQNGTLEVALAAQKFSLQSFSTLKDITKEGASSWPEIQEEILKKAQNTQTKAQETFLSHQDQLARIMGEQGIPQEHTMMASLCVLISVYFFVVVLSLYTSWKIVKFFCSTFCCCCCASNKKSNSSSRHREHKRRHKSRKKQREKQEREGSSRSSSSYSKKHDD